MSRSLTEWGVNYRNTPVKRGGVQYSFLQITHIGHCDMIFDHTDHTDMTFEFDHIPTIIYHHIPSYTDHHADYEESFFQQLRVPADLKMPYMQ